MVYLLRGMNFCATHSNLFRLRHITLMEQNNKKIFIFLTGRNDWGLFKRRNESLLLEISKRETVEYAIHIEPITLLGFINLTIKLLKRENLKDENIRHIYKLHFKKALFPLPILADKKIYVYSLFVLYTGKNTILRKLSNLLIKLQGKIINKKFNLSRRDIVLVVYPPSYYLLQAIKTIKHDMIIADLVDDVIERISDDKKKKFVEHYKNILSMCDWVFSTSPVHREAYGNYTKHEIEFLPNGVDVEEFSVGVPEELVKNNGRKTVGYVGYIGDTADMDLLEYIVSCNPNVTFYLIGPVARNILEQVNKIVHQYKNCRYLGIRRHTEIVAYISSFDVLINFKKADYRTRGNDCMKIYQYLAVGKPVVSTPISPAERFKDIIYVALDKFQFEKYLKQALEEDNKEVMEKRIKTALQNSWKKRADVILHRISEFGL